jgi:hypothetical protein
VKYLPNGSVAIDHSVIQHITSHSDSPSSDENYPYEIYKKKKPRKNYYRKDSIQIGGGTVLGTEEHERSGSVVDHNQTLMQQFNSY